jgi:TetR/AcrR family transcriptional regulator, tetracycline repressor protein
MHHLLTRARPDTEPLPGGTTIATLRSVAIDSRRLPTPTSYGPTQAAVPISSICRTLYVYLVRRTGSRGSEKNPIRPWEVNVAQKGGRLSRRRILRAAMRLADRHGIEALSMRRLADELGAGTMSLYGYVPSKDALLKGIVEIVLADVEVPPEDLTDWRERLKHILRSFRQVAHRHPCVIALIPLDPPSTPSELRPMESGIKTLRDAGFDEQTAARAFRIAAGYAIGYVSLELGGFFGNERRNPRPEAAMPSAALDLEAFPNLVAISPYLVEWDPATEFDAGLDVILSGLAESRDGR